MDEKGSPESPVDQYGHPMEFEKSKATCQKYIGQLKMWLATRTRPDISPVLGMIGFPDGDKTYGNGKMPTTIMEIF